VPEQPLSSDPQSTFGPNEWLVDELYESYLKDRNSVDKAWWDFFKDYEPGEATYGRDYAVKSNHTPAAATRHRATGQHPRPLRRPQPTQRRPGSPRRRQPSPHLPHPPLRR
jgi:2-oxoglutarate decarboxylase